MKPYRLRPCQRLYNFFYNVIDTLFLHYYRNK